MIGYVTSGRGEMMSIECQQKRKGFKERKVSMNFEELFTKISEEVIPIIKRYREEIDRIEIQVKDDKTLLTEADKEVQKTIVSMIEERDADPSVVAEEECLRYKENKKYTYVIDPIDGTAQFVKKEKREFCTAVAVLEAGIPIASMIVLHELGKGRTPIVATAFAGDGIYINGEKYEKEELDTIYFSATRSKGKPPYECEEKLLEMGYELKNSTTSQSIDILRTAVDLSELCDEELPRFVGFVREKQHLWDGVPGMVFAKCAGLGIYAREGEILPYSAESLGSEAPKNEFLLIAKEELKNKIFEKNR